MTGGDGIVRGRVRFSGTPPVMAEIPNRPCHDGAGPFREETVVVNADGTLRNVLVHLADVVAEPATGPVAAEPPVLDQVGCRYVPHVLGVRAGSPVVVTTSDPGVTHNVHYDPARNRPANFGLTAAGERRTVTFDRAEFVRVKCDVHPWMTAYVGVFDNPWFAATGEAGTFEITGLPRGTHTLAAWHERYGTIETSVTITGSTPVDVEFEYK